MEYRGIGMALCLGFIAIANGIAGDRSPAAEITAQSHEPELGESAREIEKRIQEIKNAGLTEDRLFGLYFETRSFVLHCKTNRHDFPHSFQEIKPSIIELLNRAEEVCSTLNTPQRESHRHAEIAANFRRFAADLSSPEQGRSR